MLESLRSATWYRGQLLDLGVCGFSAATPGEVGGDHGPAGRFVREAVGALSPGAKLYDHQAMAITALLDDRDVLMAARAGSGRRAAAAAVALAHAACLGRHSLLLCPTAVRVRESAGAAAGLAAALNLSTCCGVAACHSPTQLIEAATSGTTVVCTTPKSLYDAMVAGEGAGLLSTWLRGMGFCCIQGLTAFRPAELAHVAALSRLLRAHAQRCRFLLLSLPIDSPEEAASAILGGTPMVIAEEASPKSKFEAAMWFPALHAQADRNPGDYVVRRADYVEEAAKAVGECCRRGEVKRLGVWHCLGGISNAHLRRLTDAFLAAAPARDKTGPGAAPEVVAFATPEELPSAAMRSFDLLVLLGLPAPFGAIKGQLGNLLRDGKAALVVVPEEPTTHSLFRLPEIAEYLPQRPVLVVPATKEIGEAYGTLLLRLNQGSDVSRGQLAAVAPDFDTSALEAAGAICPMGEDHWTVCEAVPARALSWEQIDRQHFSMRMPDGATHRLDQYRFPFSLHEGGLFTLEGAPYRIDLAECALVPAAEDHPVATIPDVETAIATRSDLKQKRLGQTDAAQSVALAQVELRATYRGYHIVRDYTAQSETSGAPYSGAAPAEATRRAKALFLSWPQPTEAAILLWLYLQRLYEGVDDFLAIVPLHGEVALVSLHEAFDPQLERLYHRYDTLQNQFARFAFTLLDACACRKGCCRCVTPVLRRSRGAAAKKDIFLHLGQMLNMSHAARRWTYKEAGLPAGEAQPFYEAERRRVAQLFADRMSLLIKTLVPVQASDALKTGIADGTFDGAEVKVAPERPESRAIAIIAHEYAHNWASDPAGPNMHPSLRGEGIPYDGKLVSEGFAQWASFKVCDHLGLLDEAKTIRLWVDDEYGAGFDFLNWVENEVSGYGGVLELITSGKTRGEGGKELDLGALLAARGLDK